jgi:hypothetical protein
MITVSCALRHLDTGGVGPGEPIKSHPAVEILAKYMNTDQSVNLVIPYIVNLLALDLLRKDPAVNLGLVRSYIDWYLDHLNYPDKYGATGSIYDYRVYRDGREVSTEEMDSVDSYAATFIMLINRYYTLTGDSSLVQSNRRILEDIIYLVPYLMQDDRLTVALPDISEKYLMDNCESLGGVTAFLELAAILNWDTQSFYRTVKEELIYAIENHLYDGQSENYYWVMDGSTKTASSWDTFYPDAYAQLFPILYFTAQEKTRREHLWKFFHDFHGNKLDNIPVEQRIVYEWTKEVMDNEN